MTTLHFLNLGAGVQSTTLELMFRQGLICYDGQPVTLTASGFADTQREPAWVYHHLNWLLASRNHVTDHPILTVSHSDIGADLMRGENSTKQRFATIPAYTAAVEGKKDGIVRRQCTYEYKIRALEQLQRRLCGAQPGRRVPKTVKLYVYYGISLDEQSRASRIWEGYHIGRPLKNKDGSLKLRRDGQPRTRKSPFEPRFPLIELGMTRRDCDDWLEPRVPHKVRRSACVFCPFKDDPEWIELQREDPAGWEYSVTLDRTLREPGRIVNRKLDRKLYLHDSCKPLTQITFDPTPKPSKAVQQGFTFQNECSGMCGV